MALLTQHLHHLINLSANQSNSSLSHPFSFHCWSLADGLHVLASINWLFNQIKLVYISLIGPHQSAQMYRLYIYPPINVPPIKPVSGPYIITCTKHTHIHTLPEDCPHFCLSRELLQIQPLEGTVKWTQILKWYHTCVYSFASLCVFEQVCVREM